MDSDFLLTLAELAVALAGFGSLASLIGRRAGAESAAVDAGRLRGMLERSLSTMILAVLPVALARFDLSPDAVWTTCGTLFVLSAPFLHWIPILRLRRLPEYQPSVAYQAVGHFALLVTVTLLATGLSGLVPLAPAYGMALVVELSVAAGMFLRVASSLMSRS